MGSTTTLSVRADGQAEAPRLELPREVSTRRMNELATTPLPLEAVDLATGRRTWGLQRREEIAVD